MFDEDEDAEGDQFMAVKPYEGVRRNMVPTGYKPSKKDMSPPEAQLDLEYVYGYRCHDTRNNLFYSHDGTEVMVWKDGELIAPTIAQLLAAADYDDLGPSGSLHLDQLY